MLAHDKEHFAELVNASLVKHFHLIKILVERGAYFFDYGNSFMKAVFDAGAKDIAKNGTDTSEALSSRPMWRTLWDRSCLTTGTARSAGAVCPAGMRIW